MKKPRKASSSTPIVAPIPITALTPGAMLWGDELAEVSTLLDELPSRAASVVVEGRVPVEDVRAADVV